MSDIIFCKQITLPCPATYDENAMRKKEFDETINALIDRIEQLENETTSESFLTILRNYFDPPQEHYDGSLMNITGVYNAQTGLMLRDMEIPVICTIYRADTFITAVKDIEDATLISASNLINGYYNQCLDPNVTPGQTYYYHFCSDDEVVIACVQADIPS